MPGPSTPLQIGLAALTSVALAAAPRAAAAAPPEQGEPPKADAPSAEADERPATGDAPAGPDEHDELSPEPEVSEVEEAERPAGGGVAGSIVDPDDPNASRAQSDLEGESLDTEVEGVPERLPRLQAAGWWTTFGAVALATTGGILAGLAETRQDEAERLAYSFDLLAGRTAIYGEVADEYERLIEQGTTYQWLARGFIIAGGATLIAGITCFAIHGARRRRAERSGAAARVVLRPGAGGFALHF